MSENKAKVYYQCIFQQQSPLRISTGDGDETDSDVMTDIRRFPLIPGTSITGVLRQYCLSLGMDGNLIKKLFGYIDQDSGNICESNVIVSDATIPGYAVENDDFQIIPRNSVCLNDNDNGTAKKGGLFDFETVECRLPYTAVIELSDTASEQEREALETALSNWAAEGVSFGARTTRGYGKVSVVVSKRSFNFPQQLDEWMKFDPFDVDSFNVEGVEMLKVRQSSLGSQVEIVVSLRMTGTFSVRKYTTELPKGEQRATPDFSPLSNMEELPVIPGTSWAGSFRHHMRLLARQTEKNPEAREEKLKLIDSLFGKNEGGKQRSKIRFSETVIEGSERYSVTRIAVDRFTNAPRSAGLFTSNVAWGGKGVLAITLPSDTDAWLLSLLSAALNDLNLGLMTIGGEANVGRGLCELVSIHVNGADKLDAVRAYDTGYLIAGGA